MDLATSTIFQKPVEEKVTYKPLGVKRNQEITERTHEQLDYLLCRKEDNVTVKDCYTDTRTRLDSNHYPIIATLQVQFRSTKNKPQGHPNTTTKAYGGTKKK